MFAAFQLGLFDIRTTIVESKDVIGGQCTAYYADKPIYDAPGFVSILAGDLIGMLQEQLAASRSVPDIILGTRVAQIEYAEGKESLSARLSDGRVVQARVVILATGGGVVDAMPFMFQEQCDALQDVEPATFSTRRSGVFAIGDAANYPGKLRLILSAFHEAALMTQAVRKILAVDASSRGRAGRRRKRQPNA